MNLDILSLYKKAQNGGLSAQEVFWLESQQSEHPYFAMAYAVLARHHYRNQSTIRNRALLKGAAFALNRGLLRSYLEDTLVAPKHKPMPVAEMKPILEEKDKIEEAAQIEQREASVPETNVESAAVEPQPEALEQHEPSPVEEQREDQTTEPLVVEPVEAASPVIVEAAPPVIVEAAIVEESPQQETVESIVVEASEPEKVAEPVKKPILDKVEAPSTASAQLGTTASDINWFLNMRLKLRTERYKYWIPKLSREAAQFAESSHEPVVAQAEPEQGEPQQKEAPSPKAGAGKPAGKKGKLNQDLASAEARTYEIGGFSGITFLDAEEGETPEDEIDTGIATLEAIEFNTTDDAGEIIMEEDDRIVEVTVSPEALNKYFKGRLPGESSFSFGEFHIELDEEEYHALEEQRPEEDAAEADKPNKQKLDSLIDKFIENEPGISRAKSDFSQLGDLAKTSNSEDNEWVTETLAKIYEKQGNISKAIKIYQKLSLRFPEKRDYFASLIENLKR